MTYLRLQPTWLVGEPCLAPGTRDANGPVSTLLEVISTWVLDQCGAHPRAGGHTGRCSGKEAPGGQKEETRVPLIQEAEDFDRKWKEGI